MAKRFPSSSQFRVLSLAYFAIGLGLMGLTGCSGSTGPATIKISGKVTYQGQPVSTGTISFQPVSDSKLRPATGQFKMMAAMPFPVSKPAMGLCPASTRWSSSA